MTDIFQYLDANNKTNKFFVSCILQRKTRHKLFNLKNQFHLNAQQLCAETTFYLQFLCENVIFWIVIFIQAIETVLNKIRVSKNKVRILWKLKFTLPYLNNDVRCKVGTQLICKKCVLCTNPTISTSLHVSWA